MQLIAPAYNSFNVGLVQRFSNYGPWTTCGPQGLSLWSFKKDRRKNKIQMNCVLHYSGNSQSLEMTHINRLSLNKGALQITIQFVSMYLCEKRFSSLTLIKTKYQNRFDVFDDIQLKLTSVYLNIQLCKNRQDHPSH